MERERLQGEIIMPLHEHSSRGREVEGCDSGASDLDVALR